MPQVQSASEISGESTTDMVPSLAKLRTAAGKTVAVLGASYGGEYKDCLSRTKVVCSHVLHSPGFGAAKHLALNLPKGWRVVVVDRNTHFNHLYVFPRYNVLAGHTHKAFIPYNSIFPPEQDASPRHLLLKAQVTRMNQNSFTLDRPFPEYGIEGDEPTVHFEYAVYALGSHMPAPIDVWGPNIQVDNASITTAPFSVSSSEVGSKSAGMAWMDYFREQIEKAPSVLVVGGGALGIRTYASVHTLNRSLNISYAEFATEIADIYPNKLVTLLHSRTRLLPRFDEAMHTESECLRVFGPLHPDFLLKF